MMDTLRSPKKNTLAYGLIERTWSMLDEIESKTMHKDEEKDQIFFGFFMPMSHGTNKTPSFQVFPPPP